MRLIMAVSADGFLARGPSDDMTWTGQDDKRVFRLLTLSGPSNVLLAGVTTYDQLPKLPGRRVLRLSRTGGPWDLQKAYKYLASDTWLLGGPTVALEALRLGMVETAFLCYSDVLLRDGIPVAPLLWHLARLGPHVHTVPIGAVKVHIYAKARPMTA